MFRVQTEGEPSAPARNCLTVTGAGAATVFATLNTNFGGRDPLALCAHQMAAAQQTGWERLRADHLADQEHLFRRVSLDLGGQQAASRPTERAPGIGPQGTG